MGDSESFGKVEGGVAHHDTGDDDDERSANVSFDNIKEHMERFLDEKRGIKHFYPEGIDDYARDAVGMAEVVMGKGCKKETAIELSVLTLYDVVLLIDNSLSMRVEQSGERIKTLKNTLKAIAGLYSLMSRGRGIVAVKFLNQRQGYLKVKPGQVSKLIDQVTFHALTRIGTELRNKVLNEYANVRKMKRPLLVIIITDGEIEGEPDVLLRKVILKKVEELKGSFRDDGPEAVAYQFATVGNNPGARKLVQDLDDDKDLGKYIDCMVDKTLEDIQVEETKWYTLAKLFLGAILPWWDEIVTNESGEDIQNSGLDNQAAGIDKELDKGDDDAGI